MKSIQALTVAPDSAPVLANMAVSYAELGRLDDAETHVARAVALLEEFAGDQDPSTLDALHAFGELRYYQGHPEEAQALLLRTFEGRRRVLGEDHASTLSVQSDLGAVAHDRGRLELSTIDDVRPVDQLVEGGR